MAWAWKVNIKQYLTEEETPEALQQAYENINAELGNCSCPWPLPPEWHKYAKIGIEVSDLSIFNRPVRSLRLGRPPPRLDGRRVGGFVRRR